MPITSSSPVVAPKFCVTWALDTVGSGFNIVSLAVPLTDGATTLTAVIVTVFCVGIVVGGAYRPLDVMVPTELDPLPIPFTCQVTAELVSLVTVAVNCAVDPSLTCPPPLTMTCGVVLTLVELLPHPARPMPAQSRPAFPIKPPRRKKPCEERKSIRQVMQRLNQGARDVLHKPLLRNPRGPSLPQTGRNRFSCENLVC